MSVKDRIVNRRSTIPTVYDDRSQSRQTTLKEFECAKATDGQQCRTCQDMDFLADIDDHDRDEVGGKDEGKDPQGCHGALSEEWNVKEVHS